MLKRFVIYPFGLSTLAKQKKLALQANLHSKLKFFALLIFGFIITTVYSQECYYQTITTEDGLPSNCIYDISQDKDGFIWISTDKGVARFDGNSFVYYTQADGLTDNEFFFAREDSKGRIWCLPSNGLPCFIENGKVHNPSNTSFLGGVKSTSWFTGFGEDNEGNIWFTTYASETIKINKWNKVSTFKRDIEQHYVSGITIDSIGKAWVLRYDGAICLSDDPLKIITPPNFVEAHITRGILDSYNRIYGFSGTLLYHHSNNSSVDISRFDLKKNVITISQGADHDILFTNLNELHVFKKGRHDSLNHKILLSGTSLAGSFVDNEQNIWINTLDKGIFLINHPKIVHYKNLFGSDISLQAVYKMKGGRIWLSGDNGKLSKLENGKIFRSNLLDKLKLDGRGRIKSIERISDEEIALNFEYRLIFIKGDTISKAFFFGVKSFLFFKDTYFMSSATGLAVINEKELPVMLAGTGKNSLEKLKIGVVDLKKYAYNPRQRTVSLDGDKSGRIWMATSKGLYFYNFISDRIDTSLSMSGLLSKPIQCVKVIENTLLIGIQGYGLGILDKHGLSLLHSSKWLNGAGINKIVQISNTEFWLCTNRGLFLMRALDSFKRFNIQWFAIKDGLLSNEVNDIIKDGEQWLVACDNGLTLLPDNLLNPIAEKAPTPIMSSFIIDDKSVPFDQNLTYTEGKIQLLFSYGCLSFKHFRNITFRYRLNPEDAWKTKTNFSQRLVNLSEGKYRIEIQAKSPASQWSESLFYPEFTVLPPVWQRWWFLLSCLILSSSVISFVFVRINRNKMEKIALDQQLTDANLKALRAQIKPHFIFNALNSVQHFFLGNQKEDALEFLGKFSHLIRTMLDTSDNQFHSLYQETQLLTEYLNIEKERIGNQFQFKIEIEEGINQLDTKIPTMLLQPLVENALWHGIMNRALSGGEIELRIAKVEPEGRLLISITDNGIGRKLAALSQDRKGGSFGLRSIQEKTDLLSRRYQTRITFDFEDLEDKDGRALGTKVLLDLPLHFDES